jgi:hypothetical protein
MATTQTPTNPVLPDFTRWQWASMDERAWWSPLFMEAANAFKEVERLSVLEGVREAAWQNVNTSELIEATQWAHYRGLLVVPTNTTGQAGSYSAQQSQGTDIVRIVYVRPENYAKVLPWVGDHHIGEMLGFPPCCRVAFRETWGKGQVDSTYEQFANTTGLTYIHTLFRWMGIRTVPHMPCSHDCEQSIELERNSLGVAHKYGYAEQLQTINEVQSWPVKWSSSLWDRRTRESRTQNHDSFRLDDHAPEVRKAGHVFQARLPDCGRERLQQSGDDAGSAHTTAAVLPQGRTQTGMLASWTWAAETDCSAQASENASSGREDCRY